MHVQSQPIPAPPPPSCTVCLHLFLRTLRKCFACMRVYTLAHMLMHYMCIHAAFALTFDFWSSCSCLHPLDSGLLNVLCYLLSDWHRDYLHHRGCGGPRPNNRDMAVDLDSKMAIGERQSLELTPMTICSLVPDCDYADGWIVVDFWDLMSGNAAFWIWLYSGVID